VHFYNKRGTAQQWIREGKQAVKMTRLSCITPIAGGRHEMIHELNRCDVFTDLLVWIVQRRPISWISLRPEFIDLARLLQVADDEVVMARLDAVQRQAY